MIIPENTALKVRNSGTILSAIVNDMGIADLQEVAPALANGEITTTEQIQKIGQFILSDKTYMNNFIDTLINRIAKVIVQSKLYRNPWETFKLGYMELGDTVEEIFIRLLKPHDFNPSVAEKEIFKREIPEALSVIHRVNYKKFYKVTISQTELRAAFLTWDGLYNLINDVITQMYTSANYDEFLTMKYLIAKAILANTFKFVEIPEVTAANAKEIATEMIATSNDLTFMSGDYNSMGVETYSDKSSQITIVNTRYKALQNVEVLATAFNTQYVELEGNIILVNSFGFTPSELKRLKLIVTNENIDSIISDANNAILKKIPVITVDKSFFMILDNLYQLEQVHNGEGLYWNYWLHIWKLVSYSPFAPAVLYTDNTNLGSVTKVTVTPDAKTLAKGESAIFTALLESSGIVDTGVTWTVSGTKSSITDDGYLTVASDETATTLTVTATSKADSTKKGTATVTVTA